MPSRKRAKGKARKAKARESNCNLILHNDNNCRHGCEAISKDDMCYKFVEQFEAELTAVFDDSTTPKRLFRCFEKTIDRLKASDNFSIVCGNEQNHKKLQSLFINLGTNLTLKAYSEVLLENRMANSKLETEKIRRSSTIRLASMVALAAVSCPYGMDEKKAALSSKGLDIPCLFEVGLPFATKKFFHERTPCQCVKKTYYRCQGPRTIL